MAQCRFSEGRKYAETKLKLYYYYWLNKKKTLNRLNV